MILVSSSRSKFNGKSFRRLKCQIKGHINGIVVLAQEAADTVIIVRVSNQKFTHCVIQLAIYSINEFVCMSCTSQIQTPTTLYRHSLFAYILTVPNIYLKHRHTKWHRNIQYCNSMLKILKNRSRLQRRWDFLALNYIGFAVG